MKSRKSGSSVITSSRWTPRKKVEESSTSILWNPHNYQKRGIKWLLEHPAAGLFADPGLGKTSITLAALKLLKKKGLLRKVLIVAPLRVCYSVWPKEIAKWENFGELTCTVLHGKGKDKEIEKDYDIYVINPEGLPWLLEKNRFKKFAPCTLVIDESHKFKNTQTKRFKLLKPFLPKFHRRWCLTGTPMPNNLQDLFGQAYIMDLGNAFGPYITHFRASYFIQKPVAKITTANGDDKIVHDYIPANGAEKRIYAKLKNMVFRLDAKDYLELPELVFDKRLIRFSDEVMSVYEEMEEEFILEFSEQKVATATMAAAVSSKLRQITGGAVYLDRYEDRGEYKPGGYEIIHKEKLEALLDLIEELNGQPLLVAYGFTHEREMISKALGGVPYIGGGVSAKQSTGIEAAWNKGTIPILLAHPTSASLGLNLQGACAHVCWYTPTWVQDEWDQFNRRVWRQGNSARRVVVHQLLGAGTVDELVAEAALAKTASQKVFLDTLRSWYVRTTKSSK